MKRVIAFFLSAVVLSAFCPPALTMLNASNTQQALTPSKLNPQIEKIVSEISAKNIEASIRKLVSFGTRHTLSSQDDPNRGIGAARRWIKAEMDRYSQESADSSGGRLIVTEDEFIQPPTQRVPKEVRLVNVVATLPGTQAESKDRIYVVSGHYDSCVCSQGMTDAESEALPSASRHANTIRTKAEQRALGDWPSVITLGLR